MPASDLNDRTLIEIQRLEKARDRASAAVETGMQRLDEVVAGTPWRGRVDPGLSAPAAALSIVLEAQGGADLASDVDRERLLRSTSLDAAAAALGVRLRSVVLPCGWHLGDHGHFVGTLRIAATDDVAAGEPVALVWKGDRYRLHRPGRGTVQPVTDELIERIDGMATAVYAPFSARVRTLRTLATFLWPTLRPELAPVVATAAAIGAIGAVVPIATGAIVDLLIPGSERLLLWQLGIALVLAALVTYALSIARERALLRLDGRTALALEGALWDRVLKLPARFFRDYTAGELRERVVGLNAIRGAMTTVLLSATVAATFSLFYLFLLFYYDSRLAVLALLSIIFLLLAMVLTSLLQMRYYRRQLDVSNWLAGFVFQMLEGIVKLRVAGAEQRAFGLWATRYAEERDARRRVRRIDEHFSAFGDAYGVLTQAAMFSAVFYLSATPFSAGVFIAFVAAFGSLQSAFLQLANAALSAVWTLPGFERGRALLESPVEMSVNAADPGVLRGAIEISNLEFGYQSAAPVLRGINLTIAAGEHVALVGPSGSGKSTLVRLLLGLERPDSGAVLYDGQDLAGLDMTRVRQQIGVVTQNGRIFAGTIMDNVRGATNASYDDCLNACHAAAMGDDLEGLPMGLHTPLTEGGGTLSGGQRQRILIARALVHGPRVLIFDEATSALDNRTQAAVTATIERLCITRVVVAHRLSTVQSADKIVVMDAGRLVESGSYDELMRHDGLFARLARPQIT